MDCFINLKWLFIVFAATSISAFQGSQCLDIQGLWYNQLGSEMILNISDGRLSGEYRTAVERKMGSAGDTYGVVKGLTLQDTPGSVFGFSVTFNKGGSVASWLGQCVTCNDVTKLQTTWLLKAAVVTCQDEWKSTTIDQEVFFRDDRVPGPRKKDNTHTPKQPLNLEESGTTEISADDVMREDHFYGKWYGEHGEVLDLYVTLETGEINGTFVDSKQSFNMAKVKGFVDVSGRDDIFGLIVMAEESKSAAAIVGQYHHLCEEKEVLETSWLQSKMQQSCSNGGQQPSFRKIRFTRTASTESEKTSKPKISTMFSTFSNNVSNFFYSLFGKKSV